MKKIKNNIVLLLLVSIVIFCVTLKDDFVGILEVLLNSKKIYIIIVIAIILISDLIKSLEISTLIKKENKNYEYKDGLYLTFKTNFFNGITPFSVGGQPFQIYTLKKKNNIDYITGANIVFKDFYAHQMSLVILSVMALTLNMVFDIVIINSITRKLLFIGLVINLSISMFLIFLTCSKSNLKFIINIFVETLFKLKIIKDKDMVLTKINASISKFKKQISEILVNPKLIIFCILLNSLKLLCIGCATYFCFKSVGSNVTLLSSLVIYMLILTMSASIPIPGASGGMEYGFIALFSYYVIDAKLAATMLLWRGLTYYLPLIFGGTIFAIENKE